MKLAVASALLACSLTGPAAAYVLGGAIKDQTGSGTFVKLDPADVFAVGADTFDTDDLYAFDEDQNILLENPIRVDIGGERGVIKAGTVVASHYVFFDPGRAGRLRRFRRDDPGCRRHAVYDGRDRLSGEYECHLSEPRIARA